MKYKMKKSMLAVAIAVLLSGCNDWESMNDAGAELQNPIALGADYRTTTRVSDAGFADGDRMGVFITDYKNGVPQPINTSGNRANNVQFTYNESGNQWKGTTTIYWKDNITPVDVVGYYPFNSHLASVNEYTFAVQTHQETPANGATMGGYEASDFLWAKCTNVAPTSEVIRLLYGHLLAGVTVRLVEGEGFAEGEWNEAVKQVWVDNTLPNALIDVEKGTVTVGEGEVEPIIPLSYGNAEYRAVVVPQSVAANKTLIGITVNGISYAHTATTAMTYTAGKMHTFTIQVTKSISSGKYEFALMNESISAWVDDEEFHDGLLREYVVVDVEMPGTFELCLEAVGLNAASISSLKVTGTIDWNDLNFMGDNMKALAYLNLYDARIDDEDDNNDDVITGFNGVKSLTRVVFPKKLRGIAERAFWLTNLSGDMVIPEGVTFIGADAFGACPFNGEIILPSTIKRIEDRAFRQTDFIGELKLPEGLEYIGESAFCCVEFENVLGNQSGPLILPASLKHIGPLAFFNTSYSGDLQIPQGVELGEWAFENTLFSHVEIPEGIKTLGSCTFKGVPLVGELLLPSTVEEINEECFTGTKISSVTLPEGLKVLDKYAFSECSRLSGVIEIPQKIVAIPQGLFYDCRMLDGVHLHKDVVYIAKESFANCYNMNTFICDATTPPVVEEGAFDGVPKDQFSVEVPAASVSLYKQAEGWKDFKRITAYSNFVCRPAAVCALNNTHVESLILNADGAWTVSSQPDWVTVSPTSGTGKTTVTLTVNTLAAGAEARKDSVIFALTGKEFTTYCVVQQHNYEHAENSMVTLQEHKTGEGINILFLGDGYDSEAIANGEYLNLVKEQMGYFFGLPPYDRLRGYFNVYAGISLSQETGINTINSYYNTCFGTIYGGENSGYCQSLSNAKLIPDEELIYSYIKETMTNSPFNNDNLRHTLVILLPNTTEYDGVTYIYEDGRTISICPKSERAFPEDTRGVVQREAGGYGFGKLGNEKATLNQYAPNKVAETINWYHERGWYQNLSTSGKLSEVPWAKYIFDSRYSDYVDVFEGGGGYTRSVFRSESQSCMSTGIPYYNTISREAITHRVMDYAGVGFDIEEFYANDTNAWGATDSNK